MVDLVDTASEPVDVILDVEARAVSRVGDLRVLDRHKLLCGDARSEVDVRTLMGRDRAAKVFTNPPYNVRISSVQGRGEI